VSVMAIIANYGLEGIILPGLGDSPSNSTRILPPCVFAYSSTTLSQSALGTLALSDAASPRNGPIEVRSDLCTCAR